VWLGDEGGVVVCLFEVGAVLRILGGERGGKREERREKREADPSGTDLRTMKFLANGDLPVDGNQENSLKPSERWKS